MSEIPYMLENTREEFERVRDLAWPAPNLPPEDSRCPECSGSLMARCGLPCDVCERTGTAEGHARFRAKATR